MAIKIHFRRFASLLLCCLLVFCSLPVQAHATDPVTAASLAITGGQLAGAGLSGEAALSLAGPVGAVVGLSLGALGVNAYVSQAAQQAGKTRTRFVLDKLVLWGAQAGYTQEQLYNKIAQGISVAADGTIQLGKDAANVIEQFGNWLFTQENAVVPSIGTGETITTATIGQYSLTTFPASNTYQYISASGIVSASHAAFNSLGISSNRDVGIIATSNGFIIVCLASASYTSWAYNAVYDNNMISNGTGQISSYYNGTYLNYSNSLLFSSGVAKYPGSNGDFLNYCQHNTLSVSQQTTPVTDEVFTGTPEAWAENKDVLNPSAEDTPVVLNPDLLNPIIDSLADGQQATMSIIDYLQALQDAWDHALDDVQTAIGTITDKLTGIQEQIAVPQTAVENPTITNPSVTPDTTPILNPSDVDPGTTITGLSFDLTNIFPFCIPFDIYAALDLLDAEPVAPSYHFHLEWPYNIVIDFTLDLSPFNQVAAVARTMEILLFIIGLAVMTRSMFIRG